MGGLILRAVSLFESSTTTESVGLSSPVELSLAGGTRLGPYEILSPLGAGGMGEVYRARDTKLNRDVALKVLPTEFALDAERLARFKREAQVLASLNHPHIAQIHGLEDSAGAPMLVMELVEGPTLAERIAHGPIPIEDALPMAKQIAEALEAAHEQGIMHRDLKPANIKVRDDGTVKVLDFGLAKAFDPRATALAGATMSPTQSIHATQAGIVLGTAAYMAPEQARGRSVDKRADVWAFGVVLYEMVTGTRAFGGDDFSITLAAVLKSDPEWSTLPDGTPLSLRRLLLRCLHKDPKERLRDIGEARIAIASVLSGAAEESASSPMAARPQVSRLHITLPNTAALTLDPLSRSVAITPDGSRLVYVGQNGTMLFVRPLDQLEASPLVRGGAIRDPFISPDGQYVGFFDGTVTLKKVAMTGGPAVPVAHVDSVGRGATWASDGTIIFGTASTGLQRVNADGGVPTVLTRPDRARGEAAHIFPEVLPGGQAVLYTLVAAEGGRDAAAIAVLDLRSGRSTILVRGGSRAKYAPSGHLVYAAAGTLRAVGFDPTRLIVVGSSSPVPQVLTTSRVAVDAGVARNGTLVYVTAGEGRGAARTLVWVDRQGRETPLAAPARPFVFPRISPDGARIAVTVYDPQVDIWLWELARATLTRVTYGLSMTPMWTPDGRRLVFSSTRAGPLNLFSQAADGSGAVERLTDSPHINAASAVSPDGSHLVFSELSPTTGWDVMALRLDGPRQVVPLVQTPFNERNAVVSPDGRWLAYEADDSGTFEIYVRPFPDVGSGRWQVSTTGGTQPLWAPAGGELFYFSSDGALMRVAVAGGSAWTADAPTKVFDSRYNVSSFGFISRNYDVAPDGQQFLMTKACATDATDAPPQIVVVQHFDEELKRLVPAK